MLHGPFWRDLLSFGKHPILKFILSLHTNLGSSLGILISPDKLITTSYLSIQFRKVIKTYPLFFMKIFSHSGSLN